MSVATPGFGTQHNFPPAPNNSIKFSPFEIQTDISASHHINCFLREHEERVRKQNEVYAKIGNQRGGSTAEHKATIREEGGRFVRMYWQKLRRRNESVEGAWAAVVRGDKRVDRKPNAKYRGWHRWYDPTAAVERQPNIRTKSK
ncbi:hypothetical protein FIBSPDRAFT_897549 [Athelia psychrophila]|uniref:Uncharacterized protein n=1 Tax=Athelia psychrophila TaxID=1759441 RepID=A0A166C4R9_9AGAM|nr:hypothetical protein FIBSPDRAFT_897549 [Fibularhizoctonia sp. CBS 109695]